MRPMCLSKNEIIVKEGELLEDLWFIKKGVVSVELGKDYKNKCLFKLNNDDSFGVLNIINGEKSQVTLRVESTEAELFVIEKKDFIELSIMSGEEMKKIIDNFTYNSINLEELITKVKERLLLKEYETSKGESNNICEVENNNISKLN